MICKFAEFYVEVNPIYPYTKRMVQHFKCEEKVDPNKFIILGEKYGIKEYIAYIEKYPHITLGEAEHIYLANELFKKILPYNSLMIHSSALKYGDKCILFSALSGGGKSTQTEKWERLYPDKVTIINDDKPIIRYIDGKLIAYGTPFAGGTLKFADDCGLLDSIVFVTKSKENNIVKLSPKEAFPKLFQQITRKVSAEKMNRVLDMVDIIMKNVTFYQLFCNMEDSAAILAHDTLIGKEE